MKTKVIKTTHHRLKIKDLEFAIEVLRSGGVIVFPTDTVYGVGCGAFHPQAIQRIYGLKGRNYTKPLPVLLNHVDQLPFVALSGPSRANRLMDAYWPGPLTLVFKTAPMAIVASRGKDTIAVRVPDHGVVKQMLGGYGVPMAATSANMSGEPAVVSFRQAKKIFNGKADLMIDDGACRVGEASSVVDVTHEPFLVLREGAISKEELLRQSGLI